MLNPTASVRGDGAESVFNRRLSRRQFIQFTGLAGASAAIAGCISAPSDQEQRVLIPTATPANAPTPVENISDYLENQALEAQVLDRPVAIMEGMVNARGTIILPVAKSGSVRVFYNNNEAVLPEGMNVITAETDDEEGYTVRVDMQDEPLHLYSLGPLGKQDEPAYTGVLNVLINLDMRYPGQAWNVMQKDTNTESFESNPDIADFQELATLISENLG